MNTAGTYRVDHVHLLSFCPSIMIYVYIEDVPVTFWKCFDMFMLPEKISGENTVAVVSVCLYIRAHVS
jgi:hypothetical protein